jgi:hypothetical protein
MAKLDCEGVSVRRLLTSGALVSFSDHWAGAYTVPAETALLIEFVASGTIGSGGSNR